ncbi:MAG: NAD(P)/FAD-dependent oxidoreductase [Gemmatimonadetes bacterium]|nr:NAD(P)/FAD-dependent oxidoreductase [Gemmatimonadota bacterium]
MAGRPTAAPDLHRVVIVGGGFGGLYAALSLRRARVDVTLLDRRNFHLFQPLLYQVATGGLSPGDISSPLRRVLRRQRNTRVLLADVVGLDVAGHSVVLAGGRTLPYDTVIVAAGASHDYFGNDGWRPHAPGLKTLEDAMAMRARILYSFEAAEQEADPKRRRAWLNFVVVGAGPTGVELAGALGELANDTLRQDFRAIDPADAQIVLVEGTDRVLPSYPESLSAKALKSLQRLGVTTRLNSFVTDVTQDSVKIQFAGNSERIPTRCVLWAAGVAASSLAHVIASQTSAELDRAGRVVVDADLTVPGHPEILVIGDMANFSHQTGAPLPGVAPVAMQQGRYAARRIMKLLTGEKPAAFRYVDKGSLATIGRSAAVAKFGRFGFAGFPAWLLWLFVHILALIEFENRVLVAVQWAWNYFTRNRGARLIVGRDGIGSREP